VTVTDLPTLNAALNTVAGLFLLAGYVCIRQRRIGAHRLAMLGALGTSAAFLTSYVIYHANVGSRPFTGTGAIRYVYFAILVTHVLLAIAIVPLVTVTVSRALTARFDKHRRIARITWPLWMYVSVTGVIVYVMLYQM
jgi:putative membrane protein